MNEGDTRSLTIVIRDRKAKTSSSFVHRDTTTPGELKDVLKTLLAPLSKKDQGAPEEAREPPEPTEAMPVPDNVPQHAAVRVRPYLMPPPR